MHCISAWPEDNDAHQKAVQGWGDKAQAAEGGPPGESVAAAAMYVLEVTKCNPDWASWSGNDTAFVR